MDLAWWNPTCPSTRNPLYPSNLQIDHKLQLEIIEWECDQEDQVKEAAHRKQGRSSVLQVQLAFHEEQVCTCG